MSQSRSKNKKSAKKWKQWDTCLQGIGRCSQPCPCHCGGTLRRPWQGWGVQQQVVLPVAAVGRKLVARWCERGGRCFQGAGAGALLCAHSPGALVSAPTATSFVIERAALPRLRLAPSRVRLKKLRHDSITAAPKEVGHSSRCCREQPSTTIDCNLIRGCDSAWHQL